MKCPYCAEEINELALACKHCGRDFSLFRPLYEELSRLAHQLRAFEGRFQKILQGSQAAPASENQISFLSRTSGVAVTSVVALFGFYLFYWDRAAALSRPESSLLLPVLALVSLVGTALFAGWFGLRRRINSPDRPALLYALGFGIVGGLIWLQVGTWAEIIIIGGAPSNIGHASQTLTTIPFLLVFGFGVGDFIGRRRLRGKARWGLTDRMAAVVLDRFGDPERRSERATGAADALRLAANFVPLAVAALQYWKWVQS